MDEFREKLNGGSPVYMLYDFEDVALKFSPDSREVLVNNGGNKYTVDSGETIAVEGRLDGIEITEKQFEEFQSKK